MAATIRLVCDAVVAKVAAHWNPQAPDAVARAYLPDSEDPYQIPGRRLYVWHLGQAQEDTASRAEDRNAYRVAVLMLEVCRESGVPTLEWCDERTDFFDELYQLLGDVRAVPLFPAPLDDVKPTQAEVVSSYDPDELREYKLFWSYMELTYRRDE